MATAIYTEKDNGDLKLLGEVDAEGMSPALLIDLLLDDNPRLREREFKLIGDDYDGIVSVTVNSDDPVNPRRDITVEGGEEAPKRSGGSKAAAAPAEDEDEAPKPAPRRRSSSTRKPPAKKAPATPAKKAPAKKPAAKPAAKKGGNPLSGKKGGGFKRNAASDE